MTERKSSERRKQIKNAILRLSLKLVFVCFLCIVFLFGIYFIPQNLTYEYLPQNPQAHQDEGYDRAEQTSAALRTLRIYNGKIGVFSADGELLEVIDIDTEELPEYDIALLRKGIVANDNEIREICEGLIS